MNTRTINRPSITPDSAFLSENQKKNSEELSPGNSMKHRPFLLLILFLLILPMFTYANAGTPLMWATGIHLLFGNAIIGIVEGLLISLIFRTSKIKSTLLLILANYASAWFGHFFILGIIYHRDVFNLTNIRIYFISILVLAFILTVVIEFPFILAVFRKIKNPIWKSIKATLIVNLISYSLLIVWYNQHSQTSLVSKLKIVSASQMNIPANYSLYYIAPNNHDVIQYDLQNGSKKSIKKINSSSYNDRLFAREPTPDSFDLYVHLETSIRSKAKNILIQSDFSTHAPIHRRNSRDAEADSIDTWFNFAKVPSLAENAKWEFETGFWAAEGITGNRVHSKQIHHYAFETPFIAWYVRNAIQIENDLLVFQLGKNQICILDPEARCIALLAFGKGPLVAISK